MLPGPKEASFEEVNNFIENRKLQQQQIGWVDAALLASALLTGCGILTDDRALSRAAGKYLRK
jgi:predicted nucleic acid-binding protein